MDERPIGVFDSGVGGISVLAALRKQLPGERFIYYGDTLHAPYGTKTPDEVMHCVRSVTDCLLSRGIKALVIACNTASAVAAAELRHVYSELPIVAMEPALKPAHELRRAGSIAVLATPMTLRLPKFAALMRLYGEGAIPIPCPGLMELIEREDFPAAAAFVQEKLSSLDIGRLDAVVLGCTHYVFLRPWLRPALPGHVSLLDGNIGTARQTENILRRRDMLSGRAAGSYVLETSGDGTVVLPQMERLLRLAADLYGGLPEVPA